MGLHRTLQALSGCTINPSKLERVVGYTEQKNDPEKQVDEPSNQHKPAQSFLSIAQSEMKESKESRENENEQIDRDAGYVKLYLDAEAERSMLEKKVEDLQLNLANVAQEVRERVERELQETRMEVERLKNELAMCEAQLQLANETRELHMSELESYKARFEELQNVQAEKKEEKKEASIPKDRFKRKDESTVNRLEENPVELNDAKRRITILESVLKDREIELAALRSETQLLKHRLVDFGKTNKQLVDLLKNQNCYQNRKVEGIMVDSNDDVMKIVDKRLSELQSTWQSWVNQRQPEIKQVISIECQTEPNTEYVPEFVLNSKSSNRENQANDSFLESEIIQRMQLQMDQLQARVDQNEVERKENKEKTIDLLARIDELQSKKQ